MSEEKKKGLLRSTVGGIARAGGATVKGTAKVAGKSTKLAAKGTYTVGKTTTKATYKTGKVAAKGGYITMRTGGKTFLFAARKSFPRHPGETKWQYRRRMAKLGFKVSLFSGKIVMAANGSATVEEFAKKMATDVISDAVQGVAFDAIKNSATKESHVNRSTTKPLKQQKRPQRILREVPPLPPGLNVPGAPPAVPPGLNVPGAPPVIPPGLNIPGSPPAIPPGLDVSGTPSSVSTNSIKKVSD